MRSRQATARSPGPLPAKRSAILAAASRVFLTEGYGAAGMAAIAAEAAVSKQTIYSHFAGKEALFGAIIRSRCDDLLASLGAAAPGGADPQAALAGVATGFLDLVLSDEGTAFFRAVVAESARFPELAEAFYESGPRVAADNVAAYLAAMDRAGVLRVADPDASARLFFGMLRGDLYLRRLLDLESAPTEEKIGETVTGAVAAFLAAHRP
jgi:TetR/AcrR family transcriptional repressor of mexJK operon